MQIVLDCFLDKYKLYPYVDYKTIYYLRNKIIDK